ncbi:MAG: DUF3846 domain-containing protein [Chloroflexi bacterium]|jgi:hypothetical protein|nr:DUF3846 domain-containing protein [Chloroflexota bacterium]
MCSRHDYEHLGTTATRPAVTTATTAASVTPDPVEAIRVGMTEAPWWAIVYPSGRVSFIHGKPTLRDLQKAVGGYLEAAPVYCPEDITAYCNEEGKLDGLPLNLPGTAFIRMTGDIVAGPLVLIGGPDRDGEDTPLPADARMRLVREVIEA